VEYAEHSLVGHREDNQDRVSVAVSEHAALLMVVDGMGGHAEGARAAEAAMKSLLESFSQQTHPIFDPLGFLHLALGRAHDQVVALGVGLAVEARPRATCAVCLVQQGNAFWAHVGDSRVYHIRDGAMLERTRDHSHVEQLLREGMITEDELQAHPMRNFVECCLGGDAHIPEMTINSRRPLKPNDVLLLCTDGIWANLKDSDIAGFAAAPRGAPNDLRAALTRLCQRAVNASSPYSDNATAATLRWMEP
jgi:serine/threonine protein phosphatase PrpC